MFFTKNVKSKNKTIQKNGISVNTPDSTNNLQPRRYKYDKMSDITGSGDTIRIFNLLRDLLVTTAPRIDKHSNDRKVKNIPVTREMFIALYRRFYEENIDDILSASYMAEKLNEIVSGETCIVLKEFAKIFEFYEDEAKNIILIKEKKNILPPVEAPDKNRQIENLKKMYEAYMLLGESFHNKYSAVKKIEVNVTISEFIRSLSFSGFFHSIETKEEVLELCKNLVLTHNHDCNYIYALIEYDPNQNPVFSSPSDDSLCGKIKEIIYMYYKDVTLTDNSYVYFGKSLKRWIGSLDTRQQYIFYSNLIFNHLCFDPQMWDAFVKIDFKHNNESFNLLRRYISETFLVNMNFNSIEYCKKSVAFITMLAKGQSLYQICYCGDDEYNKNYRLFLQGAIHNFDKLVERQDRAVNTTIQALCRCIRYLYKNGFATEMTNLVNRIDYCSIRNSDKIKRLKDAIRSDNYHKHVERPSKTEVSDNIKKFFQEYVTKNMYSYEQDEELFKKIKSYFREVALEKSEDYLEIKEIYNSCLQHFIKTESPMRYKSVFMYINEKICDKQTLENIAAFDFKLIMNNIIDFSYDDFSYTIHFISKYYSEFDNQKNRLFMHAFLALGKEGWVNDDDKRQILGTVVYNIGEMLFISDIIEKNNKSLYYKIIYDIINPKYCGWGRANVTYFIGKMLKIDNFINFSQPFKLRLIHYAKNKPEFYNEFKNLLTYYTKDSVLWGELDLKLKVALFMHANDYLCVEDNKILNNFRDELLKELEKNNYYLREFKNKYGILPETLAYHIVKSLKSTPEKTANVCAIMLCRFVGTLCIIAANKRFSKNRHEELKKSLSVFISNPVIRPLAIYQSKQIYSLLNSVNIELRNVALHRFDKLSNINEDIIINLALKGEAPLWFGKNIKTEGGFVECLKVINICDIDLEGKVQKQYYNETEEDRIERTQFLIDWQKKMNIEEPVVPSFLLVQKNGQKYSVLSGAKHVLLCVNAQIRPEKIMVTELYPARCGDINFTSEKSQFDSYENENIYSIFHSLYSRIEKLSLLKSKGNWVKRTELRIKDVHYNMLDAFLSFYRGVLKKKRLMKRTAVKAYYPYIATIEKIISEIENLNNK